MKNKELIQEWINFTRMDFLTAKHLYGHMYPKPLEIICYHCQQSIEKLLKGVLISKGVTIKKTHDLGLLAEMLQEYETVDEKYLEMCDDLKRARPLLIKSGHFWMKKHQINTKLKKPLKTLVFLGFFYFW